MDSPTRLTLDFPLPLSLGLSSETLPVSDGGEADRPTSDEGLPAQE